MPIRTVKQRSDRGKIKDLARSVEVGEPEVTPSAFELRMGKLFEFAQLTNNKDLQSVLGFITTDYISDKNALPLSVYRIRQVVADIKSKSPDIDKLSQELVGFLSPLENTPEADAYWKNKLALKKTASKKRKPPFWRASRK